MLRLGTELGMVSGLAGVETKAWIWNWCRFGGADDGTDAQAGLDWCLGLTQVLNLSLRLLSLRLCLGEYSARLILWQEQG